MKGSKYEIKLSVVPHQFATILLKAILLAIAMKRSKGFTQPEKKLAKHKITYEIYQERII